MTDHPLGRHHWNGSADNGFTIAQDRRSARSLQAAPLELALPAPPVRERVNCAAVGDELPVHPPLTHRVPNAATSLAGTDESSALCSATHRVVGQ